jgi:sorbitol-specific phosphotransferase system component IIBC
MANRRSRITLRLAVVSIVCGFGQLLCHLSPAAAAAAVAGASVGYDIQRHAIENCECIYGEKDILSLFSHPSLYLFI